MKFYFSNCVNLSAVGQYIAYFGSDTWEIWPLKTLNSKLYLWIYINFHSYKLLLQLSHSRYKGIHYQQIYPSYNVSIPFISVQYTKLMLRMSSNSISKHSLIPTQEHCQYATNKHPTVSAGAVNWKLCLQFDRAGDC